MGSSCYIVCGLALLLLLWGHNPGTRGAAAATDSEIVEAQTADQLNASQLNAVRPVALPNWNPNGTMQVQPYNILEANCPHGYVLANKHCHKRVK
ncbi:Hypothetical predicted protein [Drosophila guanche]|uniref:Uncharacterized protein n=1 Tax=Drosophila guanche TaxID=7266 RepID=A0A3B0J1S9_DROGU|nr:Hypothetical predicted protein [Drosophila guanche]